MQENTPQISPEFLPILKEGLSKVEDAIHDLVRDAVMDMQNKTVAPADMGYVTRGMATILMGAYVNLHMNTAESLFTTKEGQDAFKMFTLALCEEVVEISTAQAPEESMLALPEERKIILPH